MHAPPRRRRSSLPRGCRAADAAQRVAGVHSDCPQEARGGRSPGQHPEHRQARAAKAHLGKPKTRRQHPTSSLSEPSLRAEAIVSAPLLCMESGTRSASLRAASAVRRCASGSVALRPRRSAVAPRGLSCGPTGQRPTIRSVEAVTRYLQAGLGLERLSARSEAAGRVGGSCARSDRAGRHGGR